ncbi:hypothetical protein ACPVPU_03310 [Sphingomonas sp. CJ99]
MIGKWPGALALGAALSLAMLAASPAPAKSRCKLSGKPKVEYQIYVPREPGSDDMVLMQLASEYCRGVNNDVSSTHWRLLDASGKVIYKATGQIWPLSARHAAVEGGFAGASIQVFGKKPGPALPFSLPRLESALYPRMGSAVIAAKPVVTMPLLVGVSRSQPGGSTLFSGMILTGHSYEPKLVEGLGGKAVFGIDRFDREYQNTSSYHIRAADYVLPQKGALAFMNMTAPDGTAISLMLDRNGEPFGTAEGLVEIIRIPESHVGSAEDSLLGQLVSRIAPLGPGFPGAWLYAALDEQGQVIAPPPGAVGYTVVRPANRVVAPVWGAVYRGASGYEVALSIRSDGALPAAVSPDRYSAMTFRDSDQPNHYIVAGKSAATGTWGIVDYHYSQPRSGAKNQFTSSALAFATYDQWRQLAEAERARQLAAYARQNALERQRVEEQRKALAIAAFEQDYAIRGRGCFEANYVTVAPLGDPYVKRWYEKCGIPQHLYGDARRLGVSQDVFARSDQMAESRRAYEADLRRRGANATAFSNAMAAARTAAGAPISDPWVPVRVTEGGRTTTQVMRQSDYDRRRP